MQDPALDAASKLRVLMLCEAGCFCCCEVRTSLQCGTQFIGDQSARDGSALSVCANLMCVETSAPK